MDSRCLHRPSWRVQLKDTMDITKLRLPLLLVIGALSGAVPAVGVASVARDRLDRTVTDVERLKAERESHALRLQAIEIELRGMGKALDRIEQKLGTK